MTENESAREIVDAALKVHRAPGPGPLESVYEIVLAHELERRGLRVMRQVPVSVRYEDLVIDGGFRADRTWAWRPAKRTMAVAYS